MNEANNIKYFAYGSNMSVRRLTGRVPSAQVVTVATVNWASELLFGRAGDKLGHLAEHPL